MKGALRLFTSNPFDENWNETDVRWGYSGFLRPNQDVTDDSNRTAQGQLQIRVVHPHHQVKLYLVHYPTVVLSSLITVLKVICVSGLEGGINTDMAIVV